MPKKTIAEEFGIDPKTLHSEEVMDDSAPVIAREQKPVGYLSRHFASDTLDIDNEGAGSKNGWSAAFPVFTSPPNTAEIEQQVAEACAKVASQHNDFYLNCAEIAKKIRSGKWREYL